MTLTAPGRPRRPVWADSVFRWWQVFTATPSPADRLRRALAIEPMTCPPDAFRSGRDLVTLEPGSSWRGLWGIRRVRPACEPRGVVRGDPQAADGAQLRPGPTGARRCVDRLLGYAVHAPSAGFSQGWEFLVLDDAGGPGAVLGGHHAARGPDGVDGGHEPGAGDRRAARHRDAYLDRYAEPDKGWTDRDEARSPVPYWHIDTGMASLLVLLGAVDEGLGACFFGVPPESDAAYRAAFGVPAQYTPIGAITIGYRAADPKSPSLKRGRRGRTRSPTADNGAPAPICDNARRRFCRYRVGTLTASGGETLMIFKAVRDGRPYPDMG